MFAALLKREPTRFEGTLERWERKGLLRQFGQPEERPTTSQSEVTRLRQVWDNITDYVLAELEVIQAELDSRRGVQRPNRWRLRRLYRWQQRQRQSEPRETYAKLISELRSERS